MFNFEGKRPTKQGAKYSLNLSQNTGPYLTKDIVPTNNKSARYISDRDSTKSPMRTAARTMLGSMNSSMYSQRVEENNGEYKLPEVYDETIKQFTNYDEKFKSQLSAAENLTTQSNVQYGVLKRMQETLAEYKQLIHQYKAELKQLYDDLNNGNAMSIKEFLPILKEFNKNWKTDLTEYKNENYQLDREVEQLLRDKVQLQKQIAFCETRASDLEKFVGVTAKIQATDYSETFDLE